ncbi:MAG TPA: hypothetical protein VNN62_18645 [Methylomirabilota bacterium]|nr:hypothetical protein [Methylomirabilota bacterium]
MTEEQVLSNKFLDLQDAARRGCLIEPVDQCGQWSQNTVHLGYD